VLTDDEELVRRFEAGEVPDGGFHHAQHVRVAWFYLSCSPLPAALDRFSNGLKRFAVAQGKPDLYHETITTAYVLLIDERIDRAGLRDWPAFAAANPDLLTWKPSILDRYYTAETLWSEGAKRTFVMPDIRPLRTGGPMENGRWKMEKDL
jgi:hypothetical protein